MIPNKEASVAKLFTSELDQRLLCTGMKLLGPFGQFDGRADPWAPLGGRMARGYLASTASTVGGGTSEIQRNIIATRGLGLPRG
jgi:alkylation response protein AidB-like acyl-CoA dehydrogenase